MFYFLDCSTEFEFDVNIVEDIPFSSEEEDNDLDDPDWTLPSTHSHIQIPKEKSGGKLLFKLFLVYKLWY